MGIPVRTDDAWFRNLGGGSGEYVRIGELVTVLELGEAYRKDGRGVVLKGSSS